MVAGREQSDSKNSWVLRRLEDIVDLMLSRENYDGKG